jgi:ferritin
MKTFKHFKQNPAETNEGLELEGVEITVASPIAQPKTLSPDIVEALEKRLGDEYIAHFTYRNAANWCRNVNYKKAAAYFEAEAASELDHAKGLQDYLTQWNVMPTIPAVNVSCDFSSLVEIIDEAYDIEYKLLQNYSAIQHALCDAHPATFNFIQKYVDIQNDSVAEYSDLLNALCLINIDNKLDMLYFEQTYF